MNKSMKTLIIIISLLMLFAPTFVQSDNHLTIGDCSELDRPTAMNIYVDGEWQAKTNYAGFTLLNTPALSQVEFLGYAPRNLNYIELEERGINYGFGGIDFDYLGDTVVVYLYDHLGTTERYTFTPYANNTTLVLKTTLDRYALSDGTALDYHSLPHPDGGACMWLVDSEELEWLQ